MELRRLFGTKWVVGLSIFFLLLYVLIFCSVHNLAEDDSVKMTLKYMDAGAEYETIDQVLKSQNSFTSVKGYRLNSGELLFYHSDWMILDVEILDESKPLADFYFCHYPYVQNLEVFDESGQPVIEKSVCKGSLATIFLSPVLLPTKSGRYFLRYGSGIRIFHSYSFLTTSDRLRWISMLFFVFVGLLLGLVISVFVICVAFFLLERENVFLQAAFLVVLLAANLFIYTDIVGVCFGSRFYILFERIRLITEYSALVMATFYINSFVGVHKKSPKLYKRVSIVSLLFLLPLSFLFFSNSIIFFGIFLMFGRIILLGYFIYVIKKYSNPEMGVGEIFFVWGWGFYFLGWGLYYLGFFPLSFFNYFITSNLWINFFFLILYNSIALIEKIQVMGMEKSAAEKRLSTERSRIASEIHDSVGADFAVFVQELLSNPEKRYTAKKIAGRLQLYLERIRDIVYMLNRDYDLACRFEVELISRIHRLERLNRFELDYKIDPSGEAMGLERCYHILRITDEWIANILKHSKPKTIKLRFVSMDSSWKLVILDDGVGLDWFSNGENNREIKSGQGLASIIWRANAINGFAMSCKEDEFNRFELVIPRRLV